MAKRACFCPPAVWTGLGLVVLVHSLPGSCKHAAVFKEGQQLPPRTGGRRPRRRLLSSQARQQRQAVDSWLEPVQVLSSLVEAPPSTPAGNAASA